MIWVLRVGTMGSMKDRVVSAKEFKAKASALLDEVEEQGDTITITKRGRPVAILKPAPEKAWDSLENAWAGKVEIVGDIVADRADLWDCAQGK